MLGNDEDVTNAHIAWARYQAEEQAERRYPNLRIHPLAIAALVAGSGFAVAAAPALGIWALLVATLAGCVAYAVANTVDSLRADARRHTVREVVEGLLTRDRLGI